MYESSAVFDLTAATAYCVAGYYLPWVSAYVDLGEVAWLAH